ncbi:MAG: hypothetical protein IT165_04325 [Bryobacterales bacterium]|nr:hypothetical protein [Bryobacterales bacterium]
MNRRRLFQSLVCGATIGGGAAQVNPVLSLEALRNVAAANGLNLGDERLRVLQPVLERRLPQLRRLREMEIGDQVAPTQGIL